MTQAEAQQLRDLSRAVRRLGPDHRDPERFHVEKSEIAAKLMKLADLAERLERCRPSRPPIPSVVPDLSKPALSRKVEA